jgi:hypothetical protein
MKGEKRKEEKMEERWRKEEGENFADPRGTKREPGAETEMERRKGRRGVSGGGRRVRATDHRREGGRKRGKMLAVNKASKVKREERPTEGTSMS